MILLTREPIDTTRLLAEVGSPQAGATVLFVGSTREWTGDRRTDRLDYEAYESMALAELERMEAEARRRWPLVGCAMVHRLGTVALGEASVAVAVSAAHRDGAFEAARWLIDTLKDQVPIWKRETWVDGSQAWVHGERSLEAASDGALPAEATTDGASPDAETLTVDSPDLVAPSDSLKANGSEVRS